MGEIFPAPSFMKVFTLPHLYLFIHRFTTSQEFRILFNSWWNRVCSLGVTEVKWMR